MPEPTRKQPAEQVEFKSGKIYIRAQYRTAVLRGWPRPAAIEKRHLISKRWRTFHPPLLHLHLAQVSESQDADSVAWRNFYASVPPHIHKILNLRHCCKWEFLLFLAYGGQRAAELFASNPALVYLLLAKHRAWPSKSGRVMQLQQILQSKQTRLLGNMGLPDTKSFRKVLAKLVAADANQKNINHLLSMFGNQQIYDLLKHLPFLNGKILSLISEHSISLLTPSLALELASSTDPAHNVIWLDTLRMLNLIQPQDRGKELKLCNYEELEQFHNALSQKIELERIMALQFPDPPLSGDGNIEPIRTPTALLEEGRQQHNCVASYASLVTTGRWYIYGMKSPQRCTLELQCNAFGKWELCQIKTDGNGKPSKESLAAAEQWLKQAAKKEEDQDDDSSC